MSYATLYTIEKKSGEVLAVAEFRNSWGAGAMVWTALCEKYNIRDKYGYTSFEAWKDLWKKESSGALVLKPFEHNVLHSTYDNAMVRGEDLPRFVESLREFDKAHRLPNQVCHMSAFASEIEKLTDSSGVCFQQTSVSEDQWLEYNEETDETSQYNINKGSKHWFIEVR